MKHIVALSGGESSAAVAVMMMQSKPILYFNDTKWEHSDLYRYIADVQKYTGLELVNDSDGRSPADVARDEHALPNNRMPFCSARLKAARLQKYAKSGDVVYFGIGSHEIHRAARIRTIYTPKGIGTEFPLIDKGMDSSGSSEIMRVTGIEKPALYSLGFEHNNCNGGCVRQGAKQWRHLLRVLPEIYAERESLEQEFSPYTFLKDISLKRLREIEESQGEFDYADDGWAGECIGMCGSMA
jgi:hypothetical protein